MKFSESLSYPMTPDALETMSLDPDFVRSRFTAAGLDPQISVEGRSVHAFTRLDPDMLPSAARAFIPADAHIHFREEWWDEGGARTARSVLEVTGAPVKIDALSTITGDKHQSKRQIDGEVSVTIPFFGGIVEKEAVSTLAAVLNAERQLATEWMNTRGA